MTKPDLDYQILRECTQHIPESFEVTQEQFQSDVLRAERTFYLAEGL